ncbi:MAG: amidohydrolase [Haliscomenobacter sp.]|uniref:amidohydrolase n=1 Tax=Haliscomenobacter sp. TaxID=2717303 RepID=UPI0029BA05C7|nr:amidohydrolase [Haliscomenobacter sp.]MDX2066773.1 amidohydrolase [Haliscomenobacter sp.]
MTQQIFYNGAIHPFADEQKVEAIWIKEEKVAGIGSLMQLQSRAVGGVALQDLQGKTLLPGFHDPHIHLWKVGDLLTYMLDLRGVRSIAEMQERLREFAARHPERPWILARGFNEANLTEGRMPDRYDLDRAVPDRPCYVIRTCAHIAVVNSMVFSLLPSLEAPAGGEVLRDKQGKATGVFTESALGLITRLIPPHSAVAYREMILAAQDALLGKGITSATDPGVMPDLLAVYRQMEAAGELKIRINAMPIMVPDGGNKALPLAEQFHSDYLHIDTVKFFADGGLSGKTAAVKQPYKNGGGKGVMRLDGQFFLDLAQKAQDAGWRIATHAIGDAAIDQVLAVYTELDRNNPQGLRHRIEHLGMPHPEHLNRMRELGTFCVSQPIFLYELGPNFRRYLPNFYLNRVFPYRSVLDAGVSLAFSSDAPVVKDFNPLMGIRSAVERVDVQGNEIGGAEKITLVEALRAFTLGAAEAAGTEAVNGSLEVGKWADLVVLEEGSPFETLKPNSNL